MIDIYQNVIGSSVLSKLMTRDCVGQEYGHLHRLIPDQSLADTLTVKHDDPLANKQDTSALFLWSQ